MAAIRTMLVSPTYKNVYFDAVFRTEHSAGVTLTEHPVQSGAPVTDHAFVEPMEVTMEIGMSDSAAEAKQDRSVSAYKMFMDLLALREPVKLVTRLGTYPNMVITSISAPDDHTTMNALRATITLRQIVRVTVSKVKIQQNTSGSKSVQESAATQATSKTAKLADTKKVDATAIRADAALLSS